jgi:hypothetical protein
MKTTTMKIQMYFAELRMDCSTGLYSWRARKMLVIFGV